VDGYDWLDQLGLGEAFCLTFVRGLTESEVLRRFGADPATIQQIAGLAEAEGEPLEASVAAGQVDGWAFVLEDNGFQGTRPEVLRAVSAGTEALSVFTNVNGNTKFNHAVDGEVRTAFDPCSPARRWGSEPDALVELMRTVGLSDEERLDDGLGAALRLADRITGVHLTAERLDEPVLLGRLVPLLSDPPQAPSWMLREDRELIEAIDNTDMAVLRRVVVGEARRQANDAGIGDQPAVAQALAAVERGDTCVVSDDSELGLALRDWQVQSDAAGTSLALPTQRHRMTDAQRQQAFLRHSAGLAVHAALFPDTRRAAYQVLGWVAPARDAARVNRRAQILAELSSTVD
jgi:Family of unknown function (DUF6461)